MRIQDNETVTASCVNTMEGKDISGETATPDTDIKFSPTRNDTANANGILSPPTTPSTTTPSESDYASSASASGRFKFFKDGKFILELWHHKNGERMYWIPVAKNSTYWPPTGHITPRQESSTSLSVSDDNSSIHSSPWQRDHCWKQTLPRKNINRELEFMMHFSRSRKMRFSSAATRRRRRRPYELIKFELIERIKTEIKEEPEEKPSIHLLDQESVNKEKSTTNSHLNHRKLSVVIKKLLERTKDNPTSSCRTDPGIVSPRKRILREMEKVSLEEMGNSNKKHRARNVTIKAEGNVVTVVTGGVSGPVTIVTTNTASTTSTKSTSSHSISSILSRDEEPSFLRNLLKSPTDPSSEAATRNASSSSSTAEILSSNDMRISRPSHCSTPVTSSLSPPYPSKGVQCPQPIAPYIQPAYMYPNAQAFITSPPISNHPPYYSTLRHNYRDSAVWCMPSISSLPRQSVYSPSSSVPPYPPVNPSPWVPVAHSSLQNYSVSENGTDVPLNLSKH